MYASVYVLHVFNVYMSLFGMYLSVSTGQWGGAAAGQSKFTWTSYSDDMDEWGMMDVNSLLKSFYDERLVALSKSLYDSRKVLAKSFCHAHRAERKENQKPELKS